MFCLDESNFPFASRICFVGAIGSAVSNQAVFRICLRRHDRNGRFLAGWTKYDRLNPALSCKALAKIAQIFHGKGNIKDALILAFACIIIFVYGWDYLFSLQFLQKALCFLALLSLVLSIKFIVSLFQKSF
jgi:hypothetical protein